MMVPGTSDELYLIMQARHTAMYFILAGTLQHLHNRGLLDDDWKALVAAIIEIQLSNAKAAENPEEKRYFERSAFDIEALTKSFGVELPRMSVVSGGKE